MKTMSAVTGVSASNVAYRTALAQVKRQNQTPSKPAEEQNEGAAEKSSEQKGEGGSRLDVDG